jgi:hypothetical protein
MARRYGGATTQAFHRRRIDYKASNATRSQCRQTTWSILMTSAPFPDPETIATKLSSLGDQDQAYVKLLLENPKQDDSLIDGLHRHLHNASRAPFLNSLKLENLGKWIGDAAPPRLQIRLMEASKSSQHPAYIAFRKGLTASGGLDKAYPPAPI